MSSKTKILVEENQLVIVKNGGNDSGTWLHPKLAIHFARWLDAKFAVWCDMKIEEILGINQASQYLNDWEQEQIRVAVKNRSSKTGETTQAIYVKLHAFMRVARYEQISQTDFQTALNYLASIQNAPEIIKPQHQLRNIEPLLSHALMCAEFIYWHDSAIRKLNKRLAFNIYDHAKDAICCIRSTADELGSSLPSHQFFEKFPWDGDYFERIEYRKQHLA